jgi:hypothetical protein
MQVTNVDDRITHAVISSGKQHTFGIAQTAEFFQVLSSSLYSDKPLAVIRETLCNAWDAHIEAGVTDKAVKVIITDSKLIIQDFGTGIHPDQILPTYGTYGGTTKVANDDVTGGFGLGCKAPFAYTNHFEVASCHQGMKTIYRMSLSSAVVGGLPTITEIVSVPTAETGLTVTIDLNSRQDGQRFAELVRRIASLGEMKVELNGDMISTAPFSKAINGYLIVKASKNYFGPSIEPIWVRYGNVVYPVSRHAEYERAYDEVSAFLRKLASGRNSWQYDYNEWRIIFQAEPNSISITPSRESLSMTPHTIATLKKTIQKPLLDMTQVDKIMEYFIEEAVNQTFLLSPPKVLFSFDKLVPNLDKLPGAAPDFLYDEASIAEHRLRMGYPNDLRQKDFEFRLQALRKSGFGRPGLIRSFQRTVQKKQGYLTSQSNWFHKRYIWPIVKKMADKKLDLKRLYVYGVTYSTYGHENGRGLTPVTQWRCTKSSQAYAFLRDIVIIGYNRLDLDRVPAFPVIRYWLGNASDGALFYKVARTSKNIQAVRDYFKNLGMTVIDLTVAQPWEPKTVTAPIPKPVAPVVKRVPGIPQLSASTIAGYFSIHKAYEDGTARITNPKTVVVMSPRKDDTSCIPNMSGEMVAAAIRLWGTEGGICRSADHAAKYVNAGAKYFPEYVREQLLHEVKTNTKLKTAFEAEVRHRNDPLEQVDHDREEIFKAILLDPILRAKFNIPKDPDQREKDLITIYNSFNHWEYRNYKELKAAKEIIDKWPLHLKIKELVEKLNDCDLIRVFNTLQLKNVFSGSPNAVRLIEQKKVREMLLSVLKG